VRADYLCLFLLDQEIPEGRGHGQICQAETRSSARALDY
jgi:hypothetical protein